MIIRTVLLWGLAVGLSASLASGGPVVTGEFLRDQRRHMVLENDHVRMTVLPDPGGTVIEFLQKKTGTDHVYGGANVLQGRLGSGWKDYFWLESLDQLGRGIFSLPYAGEFRTGEGYKAIYVTCTAEGRKIEREMRLAENSAELTTISRITNVGGSPQRLAIRWHTYSTLNDTLAENSAIIAPGRNGQARKCFIGSGWDHQFMTDDGYWMAVNYKNGSGMWMTFKKEQNRMQITWTDYNHSRQAPSRGAYIAEPHPQAVLAQPGESVTYESTFFPFTPEDQPAGIPLGVLSDAAEQTRAREFLTTVLSNLAAVGPYTMTPGTPPAGYPALPSDDNRFSFSHRRRDRFTLRPWGILDALFELPGVQEKTVRGRYYTRLFDTVDKPLNVSFRFNVFDATGTIVKQQLKSFTVNPDESRELDVRDDISIADLPDGSYRFEVLGMVEGEKQPVHQYSDEQRLVGQARAVYEKATAEREAGPLVERPFVKALREISLPQAEHGTVTVPVGVEDASGIARSNWPVRLGVPFAQGALSSNASFEVRAPDGGVVPLQTQVMATWMDGSLKWVLFDFLADVPADSHVFYTLHGSTTASQNQPAKPLATLRSDSPIFVSGPLANAPADRLLGLFGPNDLWWEDGTGQKYHFRLEGEEAGVVIEENGPNYAVIKATGWYVNGAGRPVCMGELRLEYARGQTFAKLYHTVTFAGDPWKEQLGSYGMQLQLPNRYETAAVALDGGVFSGKHVSLHQPHPDGASLVVDGRESTGRRGNGGVILAAPGKPSCAVYHREFWQMAPKKLIADASTGTVSFAYWPTEAGPMSFLPREDGWLPSSSSAEAIAVGMGRTHEIVIDFDARRPVTDCDSLHDEPVMAIVPPRHLAATRAMMHLSAYDPERNPIVEKVISDTIDHFIAQREMWGWYGQWFYGAMPNFWVQSGYKWWNFGRYAWILNEQDVVQTPWLCYHRSGDRKYLKFARSNTRHLMEVATIRWNPVWPTYVGFSRRHHECIWLSGGDAGHSMLDPFLDYYYATGYRPARDAAERLAKGMATVTSGTWRYLSNPIAGLSRMYLDTQNPFYKEHADRIWNTLCFPDKNEWFTTDHANRMVLWYSQINPRCLQLWKEWTLNPDKKGCFDGIDILAGLYQITGDRAYADAAIKQLPTGRMVAITQYVLADLRALCYAGELRPTEASPRLSDP